MTASAPLEQSKWDDLKVRIVSGVAMIVVGALAVVLGGIWFQMLVVFATAVMIWELWMMIAPDRPAPGMVFAALNATVWLGQLSVAAWAGLAFLLVVPCLGAFFAGRARVTFLIYALAIQIAGWGLITLRGDDGLLYILWLVAVVVITDIAGYFAGRAFGGPKFWPTISPKKTWSGTIAGWVGAAVIGLCFVLFANAGLGIVAVSIVLSFASQMGDIAESALKRRMKIKDSSDLIPGHGGLLDRFDGLLGASLLLLVITTLFDGAGVQF